MGGGEGGGVGGVVWDRGCPCCAFDLCLCLAVGSAPLLSSILGCLMNSNFPMPFDERGGIVGRPGPARLDLARCCTAVSCTSELPSLLRTLQPGE